MVKKLVRALDAQKKQSSGRLRVSLTVDMYRTQDQEYFNDIDRLQVKSFEENSSDVVAGEDQRGYRSLICDKNK